MCFMFFRGQRAGGFPRRGGAGEGEEDGRGRRCRTTARRRAAPGGGGGPPILGKAQGSGRLGGPQLRRGRVRELQNCVGDLPQEREDEEGHEDAIRRLQTLPNEQGIFHFGLFLRIFFWFETLFQRSI